MSSQTPWPGKSNPITAIGFSLMAGFDPEGQPKYTSGSVTSAADRELLQEILEPLRPVPHTITSVTMGEVRIQLKDGSEIRLQPVFRPSLDSYQDLFFVEQGQYPMPEELSALLESWRKNVPA